MISPISTAHPREAHEASPPAPKPEHSPHQTPKSGDLSHDQVTLKSAGQVDHDGGGT